MDINKESEKITTTLHELKNDMEILSKIVEDMLASIENVKTKEDAMAFNERFANIDEQRLKHIRLF